VPLRWFFPSQAAQSCLDLKSLTGEPSGVFVFT
jgi:hypothetical protein